MEEKFKKINKMCYSHSAKSDKNLAGQLLEEEIFFSLLALVNLKTKAGGKISALVFTALSFATVSFYAVQDVKINKKRTWEGCKGNLI